MVLKRCVRPVAHCLAPPPLIQPTLNPLCPRKDELRAGLKKPARLLINQILFFSLFLRVVMDRQRPAEKKECGGNERGCVALHVFPAPIIVSRHGVSHSIGKLECLLFVQRNVFAHLPLGHKAVMMMAMMMAEAMAL